MPLDVVGEVFRIDGLVIHSEIKLAQRERTPVMDSGRTMVVVEGQGKLEYEGVKLELFLLSGDTSPLPALPIARRWRTPKWNVK